MLQESSTFLINPTRSTPFVEFDTNDGKLDIIGKKPPEGSPEFYRQINLRIKEFLSIPHQSLNVNISFEDAEVMANEDFFDLLKVLKAEANGQQNVFINWYYDGYEDAERRRLEAQMNKLGISCHIQAYSE